MILLQTASSIVFVPLSNPIDVGFTVCTEDSFLECPSCRTTFKCGSAGTAELITSLMVFNNKTTCDCCFECMGALPNLLIVGNATHPSRLLPYSHTKSVFADRTVTAKNHSNPLSSPNSVSQHICLWSLVTSAAVDVSVDPLDRRAIMLTTTSQQVTRPAVKAMLHCQISLALSPRKGPDGGGRTVPAPTPPSS